MKAKTVIKAYVAYRMSPLILALAFAGGTLLLLLPIVLIDLYQRYVVQGVPFPQ